MGVGRSGRAAASAFELHASLVRGTRRHVPPFLELPRIDSNHLARAMTRKPFQSKLRPHLEFIRECRAQEMSYPQIAAELRARFSLSAAPSTIFAFVRVRARRRAVFALPPQELAAPAPNTRPMTARVSRPPPADVGNWLNYDSSKPLEKLSS